MENKPNDLAPVPDIIESVKILLAGKASRENGGTVVALAELDKYNPSFDGAKFETEYAAVNIERKIYLT